ncbi:hypothetical protein MKW98_020609 [Papaver atlanticum]|uniref:PGG domain-containing protein n=1 Tax=Papaver atlanticum TaxID=357466 RepID=A0AAD4XY80_9MAGN|nr:hypothetical protein MKW98_020609 [Papaver atlanticum]
MAAAGELVGDDQEFQDSRNHHQLEMKSLGLQQVESLGRVEILLRALVESQVNTQLQLSQMVNTTSITTSIDCENDEEKHKAVPINLSSSPSINPLHYPALAPTTIATPEEDTITTTAATEYLAVNIERLSTVNDNPEITQTISHDHNARIEQSAEDVCQVMSKDVFDGYEELYQAAENGDWKVARKFLKKNPEAVTKVIASDSRTALHVAIIQGNLMFTEEIVKRMPPEVLEYKTSITGYTALHYAALCGYTKAAEILVNKNLKLTQIEDKSRRIPLVLALISVTGRQRGTVEYLYSVTRHEHPSPFCGNQGDSLLRHTIDAGYYDIASSLVQRFPELVIDNTKKVQTSAMNNMAERPFAFASGAKYTFWQRRIYSLVKVDINTEYEFDAQPNIKGSDESHPQSLERTNGEEENRVKRFEGSYKAGKKPPENAENTQGDEEKWSKPKTVAVYMLVPIIIVPYLIFIIIKSLYLFVLRFTPWSPVVKVERNSYESHSESLEGIDVDEENPVERFEGCYGDEKNPPENSENTQGEKEKHSKAYIVGYYIIGPIFIVVFIVPYLIYLMIKFFFVFLMRFIWSPVTPIQQVRKQFYDDKVKHKQAEALVKIIFTTLKDRMSKVEVIDFFGGSNIMKMAIRHGSVEIVEVCIKLFPYLIWTQLSGKTMIQMAIAERNETILDLLCEESGKNKIDLVSRCDDKDSTILHYAAKLAPPAQLNSVSGAYLQMQREKQWFKGVENMIPEKDRFKRNADGDTAHNIFTKEHKELKESGEKWLKDTSGSCMVVAALIATVSFASAFTVPGGNFSESNRGKIGTPVFLKDNSFIVFAVADALALLSGVTSVLMFLAIYTSRYAEVDFLKSLPNKLILGLATLFISMASVLVAFGASLYIVLGDRYRWVLIPIVVVSCVPVTLFGWLQLPLFLDMIR